MSGTRWELEQSVGESTAIFNCITQWGTTPVDVYKRQRHNNYVWPSLQKIIMAVTRKNCAGIKQSVKVF